VTAIPASLVVKVGGGESLDRDAIARDLASCWRPGMRWVLVHGAGEAANRLGAALGVPPRFITSPSGHQSRFTDRATLEVFRTAVMGENAAWVERLQRLGVNAFGVSGLDGRLLLARHKATVRSLEGGRTKILHGDHTGSIESVELGLLDALHAAGTLPVVAPLAISHAGVALNVDGDRTAATIAAAIGAEALLLLTGVPGLLRELGDEGSLLAQVDACEPALAMELAAGRMKKKLMGAVEACRAGVATVVIADGRVAAPLQRALDGRGTVVA
jgi:[amino group carrier protein]-L-2-aminoadipate 6-kinase